MCKEGQVDERAGLMKKNLPLLPQASRENKARARTILAILALWCSAPVLLLWAFCAWLKYLIRGPKTPAPERPLNVLVTGGKMSKASAVARAVGRDGHRVFTAEILPYRLCHTRFCRYVLKHYVLPRPVDEPEAWQAAIKAIVEEQGIDLIIPCTAPIESSAYAHLRSSLPSHVRVFAFDGEVSDVLDNKYSFNQELVKAGVSCPKTSNMECLEDAEMFFQDSQNDSNSNRIVDGTKYIVKPAVYDPAARSDILFLPIDDAKRQREYLASRRASKRTPYVIQEVLSEPELGCYAIYNKGELTGFELFKSAASCLVYQQFPSKDKWNDVRELCRGLGKSMGLTGQLTLDVMYNSKGELVPIECNPRIHSAVCIMEGHPALGALLTDPDYTPASSKDVACANPKRLRYWSMDQLFLMLGFWKAKNCIKLSVPQMAKGSDALLHGDDPMPFLAMYLLQIPSLLLGEVAPATPWLKIDFCIGKIVKEGGD